MPTKRTKLRAPRSFCFMVMPFGKRTLEVPDTRRKVEIDFDALWDKAYEPALRELGYIAVRGDDRTLTENILRDILENLAFSDLVVADITAINANVFYEVGIRHAVPGPRDCVLLAAEWARPPFDVQGIRQLRYPLPTRTLVARDYAKIRDKLVRMIPEMVEFGTPMSLVKCYPKGDEPNGPAFEKRLDELQGFQADARAVRLAPDSTRAGKARAFLNRYGQGIGAAHYLSPAVAFELVVIARDCVDARAKTNWRTVRSIIERLPPRLRKLPVFIEQAQLAAAKLGDFDESIARLEELIRRDGSTPEREGLLGGRWKQRLEKARTAAERERALDRMIEHYTRGMQLDLNEYYCSTNLPRRLRQRGRDGDEARALAIIPVVQQAAARALALVPEDRWALFTLLGVSCDAGDVERAKEFLELVRRAEPATWEVDTTLADVELSISQQPAHLKRSLQPIADKLRALRPTRS